MSSRNKRHGLTRNSSEALGDEMEDDMETFWDVSEKAPREIVTKEKKKRKHSRRSNRASARKKNKKEISIDSPSLKPEKSLALEEPKKVRPPIIAQRTLFPT